MEIRFEKKFEKLVVRADPKIKRALKKRIALFINNPHHTQLNNHKLKGKYSGFRSINVTGDWRAVYAERSSVAVFVDLGTHSQLYQ